MMAYSVTTWLNIPFRLTNEDDEGNGLGASSGYEEVDGGAGIALSGVARSRFLDGLRDVVDLGIFS